jgi:hypothetical protein
MARTHIKGNQENKPAIQVTSRNPTPRERHTHSSKKRSGRQSQRQWELRVQNAISTEHREQ